MRKRHSSRPVLESMEDRLVLSVAGAATPAAEVIAARAKRLEAHAAHTSAVHDAKSKTATPHQHASKTAHPAHHSTTKPKKSSSSNSILSDFVKSVFPF